MIGRKFSRWLAGAFLTLSALVQAQNNATNSRHGFCDVSHADGQNSPNGYSTGDPSRTSLTCRWTHDPVIDGERLLLYVLQPTQVACSKPLKGNYGQQEQNGHNNAGALDRNARSTAQPSGPSTVPSWLQRFREHD